MGQSVKPEGWEARLNKCIEDKMGKPFAWGTHDCSLFALDCADAQLGTSYAKDWRGKYRSAKSAYEILDEHGGYAGILAGYGFKEKPIAMAGRGDLAFLEGDLAMGVVLGDRIISTGHNGLESLPVDKAITVWELPCHQ